MGQDIASCFIPKGGGAMGCSCSIGGSIGGIGVGGTAGFGRTRQHGQGCVVGGAGRDRTGKEVT